MNNRFAEEFERTMLTILVVMGLVAGLVCLFNYDDVQEHYAAKMEGRPE
ncbi:MAG: hypothetical protein ACK5QX_00780 [bacterium]|jgi:hypothetical protein